MLFYESAKCLHGRMNEFRGKYYGSIFVHYQPVDTNIWSITLKDSLESIPEYWSLGTVDADGSRWAGQAITTDDRVAANAPPRIIENINEYNEYIKNNFDENGLFIPPKPRNMKNITLNNHIQSLLNMLYGMDSNEKNRLEKKRKDRIKQLKLEKKENFNNINSNLNMNDNTLCTAEL